MIKAIFAKMNKLMLIILGFVLIGTAGAEIILYAEDLPTNLNFACRNGTDFIGSSATITCYNGSQQKDADAVSLTNIATGLFNYTVPAGWEGHYLCYVDCGSGDARPRYVTGYFWITDRLVAEKDAITSADLINSSELMDEGELQVTVWNESQSNYTTSGTFGYYLNSQVSGISSTGLSSSQNATLYGLVYGQEDISLISNDTNTEVKVYANYKANVSGLATSTEIENLNESLRDIIIEVNNTLNESIGDIRDTVITKLNNVNASIPDLVWDEDLSGHTTPGTAGNRLGDTWNYLSNGSLVDDVWDETTAGHTTAGTFGRLIRDIIKRCRHINLSGY